MSNIISSIANALKPAHRSDHTDHQHHIHDYEHEPIVQEHLREHHEQHVTPVVEKTIDQPIIHHRVRDLQEEHVQESHTETEAQPQHHVTSSTAEQPTDVDITPQNISEDAGTETITHSPIVHETVQERHIDEVHPVVTHNVDHHHVEHITQPIHVEHHAAPIVDDSALSGSGTVAGEQTVVDSDSDIKQPFEV
jgi:hypothetical protein